MKNNNQRVLNGILLFDRGKDGIEYEYKVLSKRNTDDNAAVKELIEKIKADLQVLEQTLNNPTETK
jgi:hypothetical protein